MLAVDHKLYKLLMEASRVGSEINALVISKEYNVSEGEAEATLARLITKKILVPIKNARKEVISDGGGHCRTETMFAKQRASSDSRCFLRHGL